MEEIVSYVMQTSAMKGQMNHLKETQTLESRAREIDLNLLTACKHILHQPRPFLLKHHVRYEPFKEAVCYLSSKKRLRSKVSEK